ncbi:MAG TPA: hypothetical protein VNE16_11285 [Vicinamibacterales bacterium]|nr:hypothetical protein [Vicinamibacterales bacterium]
MSHPLVLGLYRDAAAAASGARAARALGVQPDQLSIVSRTHEDEIALAREVGGSPGAEMEDSRPAGRLGELGAHILAAVAIVLPGIGPIVTAGPLAAELGEVAGHAAGDLAGVLGKCGLAEERAHTWETRVHEGAVLLGAHIYGVDAGAVRAALAQAGADETALGAWVTHRPA